MQILFLDESGTPPLPGQTSTKYFVLAGIIVPESVWPRLRDALFGMKIRLKIRGEIKWRYFAASNNDIRNPMRALDQSGRDAIRTEIYQIIVKEAAIRSLAAICSVEAAYKMTSVNGQQDIYNLTYKALTERFQYFLQDFSRATGRMEYGMIIGDHRGRDDDRKLRAHHQMLVHSTAAFTSTYKNIIESVLLQPSNMSVGIQLADIIAGAIWRKFERNDERWFELMKQSLRQSPHGKVDGFGLIKVPKAGWI
jgi:hypothetical protein